MSAKSLKPQGIWEKPAAARVPVEGEVTIIRPSKAERVHFDVEAFRAVVAGIRVEGSSEYATPDREIWIPDPDGGWRRFFLIESPVMEPELAAKFPEIRSFRGVSPDDPGANLRMSISHKGCRVQVISPRGTYYVEPHVVGNVVEHLSYYRVDLSPEGAGLAARGVGRLQQLQPLRPCTVIQPKIKPAAAQAEGDPVTANRTGETLRSLRLAIAATGEYTQFHGGTVPDGIAALNDLVTRITGIYELEIAVRMTLVANNDLIVYTNGATDPYGADPLDDVQADIDAKIGNANYDVGHVVSTGNGGVAFLGSVYVNSIKARGYTGLSNPTGDPFWVDYVAHELGHQFGATHTFNYNGGGSCSGGNRSAGTAYEPGGATTIMGYAGICGSTNNVQNNSDAYFHHASLDQMNAHLTSVGVPSGASTGNTIPENITAGPDVTIPANTPFTLTASATDPDGDTLTYCWEQRDLGPAQSLTDPDNGSSPLFRTYTPTTSPSRTFPRLAELLQNTTPKGEQMPTVSRNMNFRVVVRDNRAGGGGVDKDDMVVTVDAGSGPFVVTNPNSAVTLASGPYTVTWNVANTNVAPVNADRVSILLSTDGGLTFPTTLISDTPNDGSQTVTLPPVSTSTARIKVSADGNIFFDVSNTNFTIEPPASPSLFIPDLQVTEGDSGSSIHPLTVTLNPANATQTVTVTYSTSNGSATAGSDYQSDSGTLTFLPSETQQDISLTLLGDTDFEGDETFTVTLSSPTNALLGDSQATVTVLENEPAPPTITSSASDTALVGVAYSYQITTSGGTPDSYGLIGTLPQGLSFSTATGLISGTPTTSETAVVTLSATNASGSDSQEVTFQVLTDPLAAALDQSFLSFTTSGSPAWFRQTGTTHDGVDAAQSGSVSDSQSTTLSTTVTGPEIVGFWWKVSSEATYDFLELLVDGAVVRSISGEVDWEQVTVSLPPGDHTVGWRYRKDSSASSGSDAGWVDEVILGSQSAIPLLSNPPLAIGAVGQAFSLQLGATGNPDTYGATGLPTGLSVNSSTGLISGTPSTAGDFPVTLSVSNASGSSQSSLTVQIGTLSSSLADAIDQPTWDVITGGNLPFLVSTTVTTDGVDSAQSGAIGDSQISWMSVELVGPGDLSFRWNVSSEEFYDFGQWSVNGQVQGSISGSTGWNQVTQSLPVGNHVIQWAFSRDIFGASGSDLFWVDDVVFTPTPTAFETFMSGYATAQDGLLEDPEGDGIINLFEYAFNLDPLVDDSGSLPTIVLNANGRLEVTFDKIRSELTYRVQGVDALGDTWSVLGIQVTPVSGNTVRAEDVAPIPAANTRFMRYEIIHP